MCGYLWVLDGEFEHHILVGECAVDLGESIQLSFHFLQVLGVKEDLENSGAVKLVPNALADNFSGVDDVVKDGLVDSCESPRAGARARVACGSVHGL